MLADKMSSAAGPACENARLPNLVRSRQSIIHRLTPFKAPEIELKNKKDVKHRRNRLRGMRAQIMNPRGSPALLENLNELKLIRNSDSTSTLSCIA